MTCHVILCVTCCMAVYRWCRKTARRTCRSRSSGSSWKHSHWLQLRRRRRRRCVYVHNWYLCVVEWLCLFFSATRQPQMFQFLQFAFHLLFFTFLRLLYKKRKMYRIEDATEKRMLRMVADSAVWACSVCLQLTHLYQSICVTLLVVWPDKLYWWQQLECFAVKSRAVPNGDSSYLSKYEYSAFTIAEFTLKYFQPFDHWNLKPENYCWQ